MLGENIIARRKQMGLSQQTLADQLHVVRQTISKWEKNLSVPDADALLRLADALETTVQALLGTTEEATVEPDVAVVLSRINDQLAIQNRRRRRIWTAAAWVLGLIVAFNALILILSWTLSVDMDSTMETTVLEQTLLENEAPTE